MASKKIHLEHFFDGGFDDIYEYISDLRKFGEIHPYMKEVKIISDAPNISCTLFQIKEETTLLGFLKIKPEYEAEVMSIKNKKKVIYFSVIQNRIILKINFTFEENLLKNNILLTEQIELNGNALLIAYFASILKKAHLLTFENLRKKLKASK
jgi:hypothetical protein